MGRISSKPEPVQLSQPPEVSHILEQKAIPAIAHDTPEPRLPVINWKPPTPISMTIMIDVPEPLVRITELPSTPCPPTSLTVPPTIPSVIDEFWGVKVESVVASLPVEPELQTIVPAVALPQSAESVKPVLGLGQKLKTGDVVDADLLPLSDRSWGPDAKHKLVRWFDTKWRSDGDYELVNYCVFPTHLELELRRL